MTARTVLLVEDNPMNLELAADLLRAAGYAVLEAMTGREGLALAVARLPDLVLLDIRLPDMDGLDVVRALRADPRTAALPVVAVTAQAMKGDEQAARSAGCSGYITKPINTRTFLAEVGRHVNSEVPQGGRLRP